MLEFTPHAVELTTGESAMMQLAERGTLIGDKIDETQILYLKIDLRLVSVSG